MSERGAFTTMNLVYCKDCEAGVRRVLEAKAALEGPKYFHLAPQEEDPGLRLKSIAGRVGGLAAGDEAHVFDVELRDEIEAAICHPLRIAVLCNDTRADTIVRYVPRGGNEDAAEAERVKWAVRDAEDRARDALRQLTPEERVAFLERIASGYCEACGAATSRVCYCRNDE